MDNGENVQEENLVNDQVAQALNDSGIQDPAGVSAAVDQSTQATNPVTPVAPAPVEPVMPTPVSDDSSATDEDSAPLAPAPEPVPTPSFDSIPAGSGDDDELMSVKQKALEQLSPLVSHLDLPADQKFDTYMEIIRASDDKTLVQPAFDAAQAIEDEDKKAQALLDVVNEVNYLTQDKNAQL